MDYDGVYIKTGEMNDGFPVWKHEDQDKWLFFGPVLKKMFLTAGPCSGHFVTVKRPKFNAYDVKNIKPRKVLLIDISVSVGN